MTTDIEILNRLLDDSAIELVQAREELMQRQKSQAYTDGILRKTNDKLAEALAQARADLTSAKGKADEWFDKMIEHKCNLVQTHDELVQARAELEDLRGANRSLGQQLADETSNCKFWHEAAQDAEAKTEQLQTDLKLNAKMLAGQCDQAREAENEAAGSRRQSAQLEAQRDQCLKERDELRMDLYHAAEEQAVIIEAAEALISKLKIRQLHVKACGQRLFCETELTALWQALEYRSKATVKLAERLATLDAALVEQREEATRHWRRAERMEAGRDFWRTRSRMLEQAMEAASKTKSERPATLDAAEREAAIAGRLAILDAVEATLADCGTGGIYAEFDTPADAIVQMDNRIKELTARSATLDAAETALADCWANGIHDAFNNLPDAIRQMAEHIKEQSDIIRVHEHALDERDKALNTESQLRREAEEYVDDCRIVLTGVRKALDECQVEGKYDASAVMRIRWLNQRAEQAEAQLSNGHGALTAAGVPQGNASGKLSICGRVVRLRQRVEKREQERNAWRMNWENATAKAQNESQRAEALEEHVEVKQTGGGVLAREKQKND